MNQKDFIKGRYLASHSFSYYSMDITVIHKKAYLLIIVDLGSKLVVAHALQDTRFNTFDVIEVLTNTFLKRNKGRFVVLHSDRESIFQTEQLKAFAQKNNIILSNNLAGQGQFGNQVSESLNRSIKIILRKKLIETIENNISQKQLKLSKYSFTQLANKVSFEELVKIVNDSLRVYNNKPHTSENMFALSPFNMDEVLFNDMISKQSKLEPALVINDNSESSIQIREARANLAETFTKNWQQILLDHKKTSEKALMEAEETNKKLTYIQRALYEDNRILRENNTELNQKLDFLIKDAQVRADKETAKKIARIKRLNAKKQKLRDIISNQDFTLALTKVNEIYQKKYAALTNSRVKLALILLYITGLRVSNLLCLKWSQLYQLINEGETELVRIKSNRIPKKLYIGNQGQSMLKQFTEDIEFIKASTSFHLENFVFSAQKKFCTNKEANAPLDRTNFNKQINKVLKVTSLVLNKNLKTHSFRATFITEMLNADIPIHKVKTIMGHKRIEATAAYDRTTLTSREIKVTLTKVNKARFQSFQFNKRLKNKKKI